LTVCSSVEAGTCDLEAHCAIRGNQQVINRAVRLVLEQVTLADLTRPLQLMTIRDTRGRFVPIIGGADGSLQ
jgi:DNA-binding IscR family transcriptional regulator